MCEIYKALMKTKTEMVGTADEGYAVLLQEFAGGVRPFKVNRCQVVTSCGLVFEIFDTGGEREAFLIDSIDKPILERIKDNREALNVLRANELLYKKPNDCVLENGEGNNSSTEPANQLAFGF